MTDDDRGFSYEQWRQQWIERGMPWDSQGIEPVPESWNPEELLRRLKDQK